MAGFFQRHQDKYVDIKTTDRTTVSTLLVPKKFISNLHRVIPRGVHSKNGTHFWEVGLGLKKLLGKYKGLLASSGLPFQDKPKLTFQEEGLDLQRLSFRVEDDVWFELGILAYGCGVSRCWLFSYLLELELSGVRLLISRPEFQVAVTTANLSRPRLIQQITGKRHYIHRKIHFRI